MSKKAQTTALSAQLLTAPAPQINADTNIPSPAPIPENPRPEATSTEQTTASAPAPVAQPQKQPGTAYNPSEDNLYRNLEQAYGESVARYGTMLDYLERQKKEKERADADARKREGRIAFISSLGDAISGVSNLVGVAKGASDQEIRPVAPGIQKKYAALEAGRKKDMDNLNTRLDKMKEDEANARLAMKLGLADFAARRAKAADDAAGKDAALKEQARQFDVEAGLKEQALEIEKINAEANRTRANKEGTSGRSGKKGTGSTSDSKGSFINIPDGDRGTITLSKENLEAAKNWAFPVLQDDMAEKAGFADFNDYLNNRDNRKRMNKVSDADAAVLRNLEMVSDDNELVNLINQYGPSSETFLRRLRSVGTFTPASGGNAGQSLIDDSVYDEFK